jgi:hypothetical protein
MKDGSKVLVIEAESRSNTADITKVAARVAREARRLYYEGFDLRHVSCKAILLRDDHPVTPGPVSVREIQSEWTKGVETMTDRKQAEKLLEAWRERFEGQGYSEAEAVKMAEIASGPAIVREAQGDAIDLTAAFRNHFEEQGETPRAAEAMAQLASGERRPHPRVSGDRLIQLVEGSDG